jgi:hypothetical protein
MGFLHCLTKHHKVHDKSNVFNGQRLARDNAKGLGVKRDICHSQASRADAMSCAVVLSRLSVASRPSNRETL